VSVGIAGLIVARMVAEDRLRDLDHRWARRRERDAQRASSSRRWVRRWENGSVRSCGDGLSSGVTVWSFVGVRHRPVRESRWPATDGLPSLGARPDRADLDRRRVL
jgi:hypothetical protein